jgi:hypothetical protein
MRGACGLLESPNTARMQIGWQRILSMVFLIAALGMFTAMHFLPMSRLGDDRGWELWIGIGQAIRRLITSGEPQLAVALASFLTSSLLIVASPFLGSVWVKSLMAWLVVLIFSGVAAAEFGLMVFKDILAGGLSSGGWYLMISTVLNFVGLLLARPQWLKKSGPSLPAEGQSAV